MHNYETPIVIDRDLADENPLNASAPMYQQPDERWFSRRENFESDEIERLRAQLEVAKRTWRKYSDYLFDNDLSMNSYIFRLGQALGELE